MFITKSVTVDNLFNLRNTINGKTINRQATPYPATRVFIILSLATHNTDLSLDEFFAKAASRALRDVSKPSAAESPKSTGVVYDQSTSSSFSNAFKGAKYK